MILPSPPESFAWTDYAGGPALVCAPLAEVAAHFLTTRSWPLGTRGRERAGDRPLASRCRCGGGGHRAADSRPSGTRHLGRGGGSRFQKIAFQPQTSSSPATVTVACAVQVADCVPLLIADRKTGAVAAVHCGWRGIALNAAGAAVTALAREWDSAPEDLVAALGPSIGACCYEVGHEVRQRFADQGVSEDALARWFLTEPASSDRNPSMPAVSDRQTTPYRSLVLRRVAGGRRAVAVSRRVEG